MRPLATNARASLARAHIGYIHAFFRFLIDPRGSIPAKLLALLAAAYVVWPLDLIPDAIPVIGWLDDLGFVGFALAFLFKKVASYRKDVNERRDREAYALAPGN